MICDVCHQNVNGVSILGILAHKQIKGRKPASVCNKCLDVVPCSSQGTWYNGLISCKHGFSYNKDYYWNGNTAVIITSFVKRKWWSKLLINFHFHEKLSIS